MQERTEYIEAYFTNALNSEERNAFEQQCMNDEAFAKDVAFYLSARQVLHEELLKQKQQHWKADDEKKNLINDKEQSPVIAIKKRPLFTRYITYAVAACLLLVVCMLVFEARTTPNKLAANFIKDNYSNLSHTMDASRDSLQLGISAYNNGDYDKALQLFKGVEKNDALNSDAKKFAGLSYLQQDEYDSAIYEFDILSKMKLFSNPGDFLKAISLLKRNTKGDKEAAHQLLQKVATANEEDSEDAKQWLKKF